MLNVYNAKTANNEFLQLLTVQLQNQNPLEPMKQENFIAQLAQFSTLEGIEKLNSSFQSILKLQEISQGFDLVGKEIDYLDPATDTIKSGKVSEFFVDQGSVVLMVNNQPITVELIAGIKAPQELPV
jgi:flagellar basal-body rod modification protein FlgD